MTISKGLRQAYDVQDVAFRAVKTWESAHQNKDGALVLTEYACGELAQLVNAWDKAQDRVRIHRGKPLPGSLKPEGVTKRKPHSSANIVALDPVASDAQVSQG